ncbi:MAG TPA: GNAT family N-acetyltransferase [Pyrinomonadaceae bacterium]|nr:GNAT family N-acetyltransferase [Pyrinomonadaceae bacterium]
MMTDEITYRVASAADAAAIGRVQVESWRESFRGTLDQAWLDSLSVEGRTESYRQRLTDKSEFYRLLVAEDKDEVIGICDVGAAHDEENFGCAAQLYSLYLKINYQRQGIGRELFRRASALLVADGRNSMYLEALAENPYRHFYEQLGGELVARGQLERFGREYMTVFYKWPDLAQTLRTLTRRA